ncbi:RhuM family protein [Adlercreutzia sp. ZJ242]|uniref:RhuM family protein n=1 Tax=Adlercreutzia sp. ZJ242 TaxID=2709409 RepID=UPI0013EC16EC
MRSSTCQSRLWTWAEKNGEFIEETRSTALPNPTVAKFATVQLKGDREVRRDIEYYNLDVVISVGYRVKSQRGVEFRRWATDVLRRYAVSSAVRAIWCDSWARWGCSASTEKADVARQSVLRVVTRSWGFGRTCSVRLCRACRA